MSLKENNIVGPEGWMVKICQAIGVEPGRVARLIIDANAATQEPLTIYITFFAGSELMDVELPADLGNAKIMTTELIKLPPGVTPWQGTAE